MSEIVKKVISLLCVMSMLFSMIAAAQSSEATIKVTSQTIEQGIGTETVEVPIEISNNTGILGMTVSVTFDNELTLINAVKGDALSSLTFTKSKEYTVTPYNLVWDGESAADTSNGVIAVLTFTVPKGTAKEYPITITTDGVYDGDVQEFTPTTVSGKIVVEGKPDEPSTDTTISVVSKTIEQGTGTEDVEVPIQVSNNQGILGMTVRVTYDKDLTLINAVKGDALSSLTFTKSKEYTVTPYNLVWDGENAADTSNGVIAVLTFTVPKGIAKEYPITVTTDGVYDGDVKPFTPKAKGGKISVGDKGSDPIHESITTTTYKTLISTYKFSIECSQALATEFLAIACYDREGRLLIIKQVECDGDTSYTGSVPIDANIDYAKIFVWSDINNSLPIAGVEIVNIAN